jgi:hypothetical protein
MKIRSFVATLSAIAVAASLAACGGVQPFGSAGSVAQNEMMPSGGVAAPSSARHLTYYYTGKEQWFTVPAGVRKLTVVAVGARGGAQADAAGALGGRVWARIPVKPGERLAVLVGGQGSKLKGGFNGGGDGASYPTCCRGYGGGGASDVRRNGDSLEDRIIVAGAGGGQEAFGHPGENGGVGGKGGGSTAGRGTDGRFEGGGYGGRGGQQYRGGDGGRGGRYGGSSEYPGYGGSRGSLGRGGLGGQGGGDEYYGGGGGGGGGGGYYGGGGGGGGARGVAGGGGGGGSSYVEPGAFAFQSWRGWKIERSTGLVVFDW